jgi:hypothetical protein
MRQVKQYVNNRSATAATFNTEQYQSRLLLRWAAIAVTAETPVPRESSINNAGSGYCGYIAFLVGLMMNGRELFESKIRFMTTTLQIDKPDKPASFYSNELLDTYTKFFKSNSPVDDLTVVPNLPIQCLRLLLLYVYRRTTSRISTAMVDWARRTFSSDFPASIVAKDELQPHSFQQACIDLGVFGVVTTYKPNEQEYFMTYPPDQTIKPNQPYVWLKTTGGWREDSQDGYSWQPGHYVTWDFVERIKLFYTQASVTKQEFKRKYALLKSYYDRLQAQRQPANQRGVSGQTGQIGRINQTSAIAVKPTERSVQSSQPKPLKQPNRSNRPNRSNQPNQSNQPNPSNQSNHPKPSTQPKPLNIFQKMLGKQ